MLLKMMNLKKFWSFFLIGFVLTVYLDQNVLSIALLGLGIAISISAVGTKGNDSEISPHSSRQSEAKTTILTKKDLIKTFLRSFFSMTSINYERYGSLGFCYAILPALKNSIQIIRI